MFSAEIGYEEKALEPFLSSETIGFHYGKHHTGYANTLNALLNETVNEKFQNLSLEQIIIKARDEGYAKVFNNASQLFNHNFYWKCLKNKASATPSAKFLSALNEQFGGFDKFRETYIKFAGDLFGSGWSWLVVEHGKLNLLNTSNAENPIGFGSVPLCVVDLWEHAYYIDYRNKRADYVAQIVNNCIDWDFCSRLFEENCA